jgi:hypothetical protein
MRLLRRFGHWLDGRGWGLRQSWFTGLAGIVVGFTMFDTASSSSGADRVVATAIGALCIAIGVVFAAAVLVLRREQPPKSKVRVRDSSFRWPDRLRLPGAARDEPVPPGRPGPGRQGRGPTGDPPPEVAPPPPAEQANRAPRQRFPQAGPAGEPPEGAVASENGAGPLAGPAPPRRPRRRTP